MTWQYFILWIISFSLITWVLIRALRKTYLPPHNDDEGGTPVDTNLPLYDPPSGQGLDDLLVDRPPRDWNHRPSRPVSS
jgi:hypothetical protein